MNACSVKQRAAMATFGLLLYLDDNPAIIMLVYCWGLMFHAL